MKELENELLRQGYKHIAGIDEAGRGPLAGPVVAAAVFLPQDCDIQGIKDSKKLNPTKREAIYEEIIKKGKVGIGMATPEEIDSINILQATLQAMYRAVVQLQDQIDIDFCIVDGNQRIPNLHLAQSAVVKADATCQVVAAASIVAKVYRDRIMHAYDQQYPEYGFAQHKGYPTKQHLAALAQYGPSPIHRCSFAQVKGGKVS